MAFNHLPSEQKHLNEHIRGIARIADRNVRALMGIAEWIEESGHPRKAEAVRIMVHQLDEAVGELSGLVEGGP